MAFAIPPMDFVELPLRVGSDGKLVRGNNPIDALLGLFKAMAATSSSAWPHAPWFGLQEAFAGANLSLQDQSGLADALNAALLGLGVRWVRVERVHTAPTTVPGERTFDIVLVDPDGHARHATLGV